MIPNTPLLGLAAGLEWRRRREVAAKRDWSPTFDF